MRPLTILSGCILSLAFLIGCRKETTQERMAPMPGDLKVEQTQRDLTKDNEPMHGDLKVGRAGGGLKKDDEPIPSDLKIVARFYPGFSASRPWQYTITVDGKVDGAERSSNRGLGAAEKDGSESRDKETKLSEKDLGDLVAKVKEADFYGLREEYTYPVNDASSLVLTITQNQKTHKVLVYAYGNLTDNKEVKRFLRVWSEILRKVPSPNPWQKPEIYEAKPSTSGQPSNDQTVR